MLCDQTCVVAFQPTVAFNVRRNGGCKMCCFGGEGYFNASLTGPGLVILQSMPLEEIAAQIYPEGTGNENKIDICCICGDFGDCG